MPYHIWKYCTAQQADDFLLSFELVNPNWTREKQIKTLYILCNHIEEHYHSIEIPKRNGTMRTLWIPDPFLKQIQKNILHHILDTIPISPSATAYHKNATILKNATPHVGHKKLLELDLRDFFSHITSQMIYQYVFQDIYFPPRVAFVLTSLCCYKGIVPQGAPTSSAISNIVLRSFDEYIGTFCESHQITYTRYCDDLTFSGDFPPYLVINQVAKQLEKIGLSLNHKKQKVLSLHQRQIVTGVVVNEKPQVMKSYRKKLRQEGYYIRKFGLVSHLKKCGHHDIQSYLSSLKGRIAFVLSVNPNDQEIQKLKTLIQELTF